MKITSLSDVGGGVAREPLPHEPQDRLRDRHRPHRSVEVAPLVAFTLRRCLHARQLTERAEQPEGAGDRKVEPLVHLLQPPFAGDDRVEQPAGIEHRKGDHFAPRRRVADAPIQRVRTIFGEADDVRRRLAAGQLAEEPGDASAEQHHAEPCQETRVEAALEQIERQRSGRDEEDEDPDRPVVDAVIQLVARPDLAFGVELDVQRVRSNLRAGARQRRLRYVHGTRKKGVTRFSIDSRAWHVIGFTPWSFCNHD